MSSAEIDLSDLVRHLETGIEYGSSFDLPEARDLDRVLQTAEDRPRVDSMPALVDPAQSHEGAVLAGRRADVAEKHRRVAEYLDSGGYEAAVLGRADSVAWFTSGGDLGRDLAGGEAATALIFVNRNCRCVITDNVHSARVFEEELAGLGFQLKERPWYDEPARVVAELTRGKRLASDLGGPAPWALPGPGPTPGEALAALRTPLTRPERQRLRELGRTLTLAVEATCRNFRPGETEAHVAGHLAHRLLREGVTPVDLRVAGDDRLARFRHPGFKAAEIRRRATITAVGRRHGLCAALTRTVSFGPVDAADRTAHSLAAMVDATCIYFSQPGDTVGSVFKRARRIYEKFGHPHEWTLDDQGSTIGYAPREAPLLPDSPLAIVPGMAFRWSPSVGSARSEDTIVTDAGGYEVVTEAQNWPKLEVTVKGFCMTRPGILER